MTNEQRLEAIAARLAAATPGPWPMEVERGRLYSAIVGEQSVSLTECAAGGLNGKANIDLISHAPDDIAWLMERVAALMFDRKHWENLHNVEVSLRTMAERERDEARALAEHYRDTTLGPIKVVIRDMERERYYSTPEDMAEDNLPTLKNIAHEFDGSLPWEGDE